MNPTSSTWEKVEPAERTEGLGFKTKARELEIIKEQISLF